MKGKSKRYRWNESIPRWPNEMVKKSEDKTRNKGTHRIAAQYNFSPKSSKKPTKLTIDMNVNSLESIFCDRIKLVFLGQAWNLTSERGITLILKHGFIYLTMQISMSRYHRLYKLGFEIKIIPRPQTKRQWRRSECYQSHTYLLFLEYQTKELKYV